MTAFNTCRAFEAEVARDYLLPFFRGRASEGITLIEKGRHAKELQLRFGDLCYNAKATGALLFVECKAERRHTGNLFIETWSNYPKRAGWLEHSDADLLAYFFRDVEVLYVIDFPALKGWLTEDVLEGYRETAQTKHAQRNDTRGRLVPVADIAKAVRTWEFSGKPLRARRAA